MSVIAQRLLEQLLPLDEWRRFEAEVWSALTGPRALESVAQKSPDAADASVAQAPAFIRAILANHLGRLLGPQNPIR